MKHFKKKPGPKTEASLRVEELMEIRDSLRGVKDLLEKIQSTQKQLDRSIDVVSRLDMFVEVGLVRLAHNQKGRKKAA